MRASLALRGFSDAFVTKPTASGPSAYPTYPGRRRSRLRRWNRGGRGEAYVTGGTTSGDFPTRYASEPNSGSIRSAFSNAFVTKFTASDALAFSTYLGGSGDDFPDGIAVDENGTWKGYAVSFQHLAVFGTYEACITKSPGHT